MTTPHDQKMDMAEHIEWNLIAFCSITWCHESNQWVLKSLEHLGVKIVVVFSQMQENFDCSQNYTWACVLEAVFK